MSANPYILYPFASDPAATTTTIDSTGGGTGPLSYQFGFTPNYEENLLTDSSALPVPRPQFNQLMLDITTAVQQQQTQGYALWVAPATGSPLVGGPASYPIYATVAYNAGGIYGLQIWESQVSSNTSVPGADANWVVVSGARGIAAGTYIDSASPNGYVGALLCDGTAYSRTTYPQLLSAITLVMSCVTDSTDVVTVPSTAVLSGYLVGTSIKCFVEGSPIPSSTYITEVTSSTITLSNAAVSSGTFTLTFFLYGNGDGSTTFNVPNCLRTVSMASGGSGNIIIGNKLSNQGGADNYTQRLSDLCNHTHNYIQTPSTLTVNPPGNSSQKVVSASTTQSTTPVNGRAQSGDINSDQSAMNIIQQSNVVFRYIKY